MRMDAVAAAMARRACADGWVAAADNTCSCMQVRDVVEPATKPGDATLQLLGTLTPLIRKLGPRSHPDMLKQLPLAAAGMWAAYAGALHGPRAAARVDCCAHAGVRAGCWVLSGLLTPGPCTACCWLLLRRPVYLFVALGDSGAPGAPAWATPPETFLQLFNVRRAGAARVLQQQAQVLAWPCKFSRGRLCRCACHALMLPLVLARAML